MSINYEQLEYQYRNIPIPGGGYVTGFLFHDKEPNLLYARTDIGGTYRYNFETRTWRSLIDHVKQDNLAECYPLSFALDSEDSQRLYIVCGYSNRDTGVLCISKDQGESFEYLEMPCKIHGNNPGRGTGERLLVDPNNSRVLYYGSQSRGLMRSLDLGRTWEYITVSEDGSKDKNEQEITFVWIDARAMENGLSSTIIVGTSGEGAAIGKVRGHSLYISTDCGKTFTQLEEPQSLLASTDESGYVGYVAARTAFDGEYLYITMSETGTYGWSFSSYSCDCGAQRSGKVMRYRLLADGTVTECKDITPPVNIDNSNLQEEYSPFGMGGIAVYQGCEVLSKPLLLCSTICNKDNGDIVFVSRDKGETWSRNLQGLTVGKINFTVPYMKPEYNGNDSLLHWLTDIKINPYNPQHAVFNSGTGCFMTYNLLEDDCAWEPWTFGIEETVHLNIYSPPTGDVKVIDILGDLGGFAFTDVDRPAENTFADEKGNRYITCMNADYPDTNPEFVVVTPRGNWTGKTKGGLMVSKDQCKSFELLPHPYGLSSFIDGLLDDIRRPNVNSGWAAVSADSKTIIWSIARILSLPVNAVVYSKDGGKTFEKCKIYDKSGECISETYECPPIIDYKTYDEFFEYCSSLYNMKVMADRVNPDVFYGFGDHSKFYVSTDGGATFYQKNTPVGFPTMSLAGIDCISYAEIRVESGKEGVIWMATNESGLWKVSYNRTTEEFSARRVTKEGDTVKCQGMGLGVNGGKALYISGTIGGVYGFWKSEDEGEMFTRINNEGQMYGDIMSITGDPRVAGRIYVATGSRGLFYGEPVR